MDDCDAGVELLGNVLNYCNQTNMQNYMGPLTVVDAFDPSLVAATNDCGYFHFCVAPGTEITAQIEGPDFADTLFATIAPMVSEQIPSTPGLVMVCEQEIPILTVGIPGFDATQATVFASIVNPNGIPAMDGGCEDPSGWSFSLVTWDGGLPIAAQHVYYSGGTAPSPNTFVTDATGAGILFDIDATQTPARLLATRLDGGGECANAGAGLPFQLEGQVPLVAGYFTVAPYVEQ